MDTSDYPSMPQLNVLHARLAAQSRHVDALMDSQVDSIEQLFAATTAQDWQAVAKASRHLASLRAEQVGTAIVREARYVCDELGEDAQSAASTMRTPKHLANLLAACRAVRDRSRR